MDSELGSSKMLNELRNDLALISLGSIAISICFVSEGAEILREHKAHAHPVKLFPHLHL